VDPVSRRYRGLDSLLLRLRSLMRICVCPSDHHCQHHHHHYHRFSAAAAAMTTTLTAAVVPAAAPPPPPPRGFAAGVRKALLLVTVHEALQRLNGFCGR
jgi:hypothetical protein